MLRNHQLNINDWSYIDYSVKIIGHINIDYTVISLNGHAM